MLRDRVALKCGIERVFQTRVDLVALQLVVVTRRVCKLFGKQHSGVLITPYKPQLLARPNICFTYHSC